MNDEIKEILDKIKNVANRETASRNALMKSLVLKGTISEVIDILKELEKRYCNEDK